MYWLCITFFVTVISLTRFEDLLPNVIYIYTIIFHIYSFILIIRCIAQIISKDLVTQRFKSGSFHRLHGGFRSLLQAWTNLKLLQAEEKEKQHLNKQSLQYINIAELVVIKSWGWSGRLCFSYIKLFQFFNLKYKYSDYLPQT